MKFATYRARARVFAARSVLKLGGRRASDPWRLGEALETSNNDQAGAISPNAQETEQSHVLGRLIYINEDLTKQRATLLYKA